VADRPVSETGGNDLLAWCASTVSPVAGRFFEREMSRSTLVGRVRQRGAIGADEASEGAPESRSSRATCSRVPATCWWFPAQPGQPFDAVVCGAAPGTECDEPARRWAPDVATMQPVFIAVNGLTDAALEQQFRNAQAALDEVINCRA
jgi:hypothetical protein